jgi:hypothetical protein
MISAWRQGFQHPDAYFGYIVLSTWCPSDALLVPGMRSSQMAAQKLPKVGYATNADHGAGCNIHPPPKQYCGKRLANSALALQYNKPIAWKSPTYQSQVVTGASVTVKLNDVSTAGLSDDTYPFNYLNGALNCTALNAKTPGTCAWASLKIAGAWVNATIQMKGGDVMLTAAVATPPSLAGAVPTASAYAWGSVPMMNLCELDNNASSIYESDFCRTRLFG